MPKPDFLIIGAQKAGSTWLADNLRHHPEVYLAEREVHFFDKDFNYVKGMAWYEEHFRGARDEIAVGEKTPDYLWAHGVGVEGHLPDVHRNIHEDLPGARLIAILRNPVERAISAVNHIVQSGRVSPVHRIDDLLLGGKKDLVAGHGVIDYGRYYRQLAAYLELFDRSQLLILVFEEDVVREPERGLRKTCEFLGVDREHRFPWTRTRRNVSRLSRVGLAVAYHAPWARRLVRFVDPFAAWKPRPSAGVERELYELYEEENEKLFQLLGREIESWRPASGETESQQTLGGDTQGGQR